VTTTASGVAFAGGGDGVLRALDTQTGNLLWSFQTGFQIAAAPSIYEAGGKQYLALTVGGTATSSFGGTASQLQVFTIGGSTSQSPAPALRPPGPAPDSVGAPPAYLSLGGEPHTLNLQVVAAADASGSGTLNGSKDGAMSLRLPAGWKVNVTVANHDHSRTQRVSVVARGAGTPSVNEPPAFSGATSGSAPASGTAYFQFKTEREGEYALASSLPGAWIALRVRPSSSLPELAVGGQTYAVEITRSHG
jgi:outer membrane protein assembly factor BamB